MTVGQPRRQKQSHVTLSYSAGTSSTLLLTLIKSPATISNWLLELELGHQRQPSSFSLIVSHGRDQGESQGQRQHAQWIKGGRVPSLDNGIFHRAYVLPYKENTFVLLAITYNCSQFILRCYKAASAKIYSFKYAIPR